MDSELEYIHEHYVESSDEDDYAVETAMMHAVLADAEHAEEHVLNFKESTKDHRVLNRNRARGHLMLMDDYFGPDALFADKFRQHFRTQKKMCSIASIMMTTLS
jgi:hypothetical protein